jgi:hypothetical protein
MATYRIAPRPRGQGDLAPDHPDLDLFARIEGLAGEEAALLAIPAKERSRQEHDRLRAIADELDRAWQLLRERAERLGGRDDDGAEHGRA